MCETSSSYIIVVIVFLKILMLKKFTPSPLIEDVIKIVLTLKVCFFLIITGLGGIESIKENRDTNKCVEEMKNTVKSVAKAVHYCNGGFTKIK